MRDVDLFVAVTSIAADPQWTDRGEDRYAAYWHATTFGELTATAEVRRAALERILPARRSPVAAASTAATWWSAANCAPTRSTSARPIS